MIKKATSLLLKVIFILGLCFTCLLVSGQDRLRKEIEKIISYDTDFSYALTPGFVVGILDGENTYFLPFGHSVDSSVPLSKETIFELGGSSKLFSSMFFWEWISIDNKLNVHTKLSDFRSIHAASKIADLSLLDVLAFRCDFPKRPLIKDREDEGDYIDFTVQELIDFLNGFNKEPRSELAKYSHINYHLLELLYEEYTGTQFNDAVKSFLIAKGLDNTLTQRISYPNKGFNKRLQETEHWTPEHFQASEGMVSTAKDIINFIEWIINDSTMISELKSLSMQSIYRPSFYLTIGQSLITEVGKFDIFALTGKTPGHSSFIAYIPETKTAVTVLSNSHHGTGDLGMLILRMINQNFKRNHE